MLCPSCRTDNIEGADVCANCGQALYGLDLPGGPAGEQAPDFIHEPLSAVPARPPAKVGASDPVGLAVRLMQSQGVGCVLVMEGDSLEGVITGWDILHKVAGPSEDLNAVTCRQVMTADPISLHDNDTIALALNVMANGGFRHVPVLRDEKPAAVINIDDLFRHLSPHLV
jgi:CBS domain-containing protein